MDRGAEGNQRRLWHLSGREQRRVDRQRLCPRRVRCGHLCRPVEEYRRARFDRDGECRSEEHTSELQSLMRSSYAVFCLKKKKQEHITHSQVHMQTRNMK